MHPRQFAHSDPAKPAIISGANGDCVSYAELEASANRYAHYFRQQGLHRGDVIALLMGSVPEYFAIAWGAQRSGLYLVCVSTKLTSAEVAYIASDSGAKLLVASRELMTDAMAEDLGGLTVSVVEDDPAAGQPITPIEDETPGIDMLYSSGTTGRPKGVRAPLPEGADITLATDLAQIAAGHLGFGPDTVYLGPAPLYHAAPLRWSMTVHRLGGTLVLMDRFDAETTLEAIERYRVTHTQWVPTHFVRMLKLPPETRARYDLSSLKLAVHAAAPCPVPVKHQMIEWWGPILLEYYAGTEGNGMTMIGSADWLDHPGSVGRAVIGDLHICGPDGEEVPAGTDGLVHFANGPTFEYHNDPTKTAEARNQHGWSTLGDIGHLDEDGFLYLTDRKSFMIISGGVNIYPQEIENLLVTHPDVLDAAVIGAPDPEMGERVVAVIQPVTWANAGDEMAARLTSFMRESLSGVKVPRQIDFVQELPRHATGKLYKRLLRDRYREQSEGQSL